MQSDLQKRTKILQIEIQWTLARLNVYSFFIPPTQIEVRARESATLLLHRYLETLMRQMKKEMEGRSDSNDLSLFAVDWRSRIASFEQTQNIRFSNAEQSYLDTRS